MLGPDRRALEDRARALGFADLAAFLADRYVDQEHSLQQIADELGATRAVVAGLRDGLGMRSHRGVRARGRSRQAGNGQVAATRAATLGFDDVRAYLADRFATNGWTLSEIAVELGVGEYVVKRLRRALGVTRRRATPRVAVAAHRGRARRAALAAQRRQARLVELGFDDLVGYLADRVVGRSWSQRRVVAELRVGKAWLRREAAGLGITWTAPP